MTSAQQHTKADEVVITVIGEQGFTHSGGNMGKVGGPSTASTPAGARSDSEKGETPIDEKYFGFSDKSIRRGFIR